MEAPPLRPEQCSGCSNRFSWSMSGPTQLFPLLCGHTFCRFCLEELVHQVLSSTNAPLQCCSKEVPNDYVRDVSAHAEYTYYLFLISKATDADVVKQGNQNPGAYPVPVTSGILNIGNDLEMKLPSSSTQTTRPVTSPTSKVLTQPKSSPVIAHLPSDQPRYFTRGSKARFVQQQQGEAALTNVPPSTHQLMVSGADKACRMCSLDAVSVTAPCGHGICLACLETEVRGYLSVAPYGPFVPVSCCNQVLPLDLVGLVISGRELTTYAQFTANTNAATTSNVGSKRKAAPKKTTTAAGSKAKGKAPVKKMKKAAELERKSDRECISCYSEVTSSEKLRIGPCGHRYCISCIKKMAKQSLSNRDEVPIRCCSKEFPIDYVEKVLTKKQLAQYERYVSERDPRNSTLKSDKEYAAVVRNIPPLSKVVMNVLPSEAKLSSDDSFKFVVYLNSDTIDLVDEVDVAAVEAQQAEEYALEVYRQEIRLAEQCNLDKAVALSFYAKDEYKLLNPADTSLETDSEGAESLVMVELSDQEIESKPPPNCTCCLTPQEDKSTQRVLTCGHLYCTKCVATRCRMGIRDRTMVPAHCCKREFPSDYVREALDAVEFETYERFLKDKLWSTLDLQSDRDYARVVKQNHAVQCPGCGVGVQKTYGCNRMMCLSHHEFCFLCGSKWKSCACSYY
ncbi:unnamed protein product [Phytophthora fragariaefolia]|uniref:Unnamed protein product n=1 Tax=Phytophthora fragariaefolia TaxID=1490495 RepID=A0A9W7CT21_9STRA|nr:unnamed protein product [Phytophthora fragariaefolia]